MTYNVTKIRHQLVVCPVALITKTRGWLASGFAPRAFLIWAPWPALCLMSVLVSLLQETTTIRKGDRSTSSLGSGSERPCRVLVRTASLWWVHYGRSNVRTVRFLKSGREALVNTNIDMWLSISETSEIQTDFTWCYQYQLRDAVKSWPLGSALRLFLVFLKSRLKDWTS